MRKTGIKKYLFAIFTLFIMSFVFPSCAGTRVTQDEMSSRKSLMLRESSDRYKGARARRAKPSRAYKKSRKRSNYYKKRKHKYKKRRR